jgi:hypothetical protein
MTIITDTAAGVVPAKEGKQMHYRTIQGRSYYAYSIHLTHDGACEALEDYFASGEICEAEQPQVAPIKCHDKVRWGVMFPQ